MTECYRRLLRVGHWDNPASAGQGMFPSPGLTFAAWPAPAASALVPGRAIERVRKEKSQKCADFYFFPYENCKTPFNLPSNYCSTAQDVVIFGILDNLRSASHFLSWFHDFWVHRGSHRRFMYFFKNAAGLPRFAQTPWCVSLNLDRLNEAFKKCKRL